ncbi:MAG: hypothetical protein K2X25_07440 [Caulobacteraceae bacterium]|nr:hypothetical protein [Caulobacteraceae bacterium]
MFISSLALSVGLLAQAANEPPLYPRIRLLDHVPPISQGDAAGGANADDFIQAGGTDALPFTPPVVEMAAHEDMRPVAVSIAFNWVWLGEGQERRPVWFARLRASNSTRSIERFADSRGCPGVEESLVQLEGLPAFALKAPELPTPSGSRLIGRRGYLHDNTYQIRVNGLFAGNLFTDKAELTGGSAAPFARIIGDSLTRLLPCWTATRPPVA